MRGLYLGRVSGKKKNETSEGAARGTDQGGGDSQYMKDQKAAQPWVGSGEKEEHLNLDFRSLMFLLAFFKDSLREEIRKLLYFLKASL